MATNEQKLALAADQALLNRIKMFAFEKANLVLDRDYALDTSLAAYQGMDAETLLTTAVNEKRLAKRLMSDVDGNWPRQFAMQVVQNAVIADAGVGATDSDLRFVVFGVYTEIANLQGGGI